MSRPSSWSIGRHRPRPDGPLTGYKIAYPMISADTRRGGFNGVALGRSQVYGAVADAVCIQSPRHRCPSSWCDCGFYCFHALDDARDLACDPQYQHCVLLEIAASGRFVRYELGLRYARQTVRSVRLGRCGCGRAAAALADGGPGVVGWRRLHPVCGLCAGPRPVVTPEAFGVLCGNVPVRAEEPEDAGAPLGVVGAEVDEATLVPLLSAEVALLQARLDQVQSRLEQLTHRSD
ncbi:hypothetical protein [Actinomycetospora aeridis]|uniref:Uncharacterized protein n=1 Tax=Actinomycetospora aeridis TaxID=3129231 RepID=A0ABU8NBQ6_9PSEU